MVEQPSLRPLRPALKDGVRRGFHSITAERSLAVVMVMIVLVSVLFALQPDLDLTFSRLFFDGIEFPLSDNTHLQRLRSLTDWLAGAVLGLTLVLLCWPSMRRKFCLRPRDLLLPIVTYGLGVGLIVNSFLKQYFGRARPRDIVEFGGDKMFTAVWQVSDACYTNCSFTSGEAAGAMALYSALAMMPAAGPKLRILMTMAIGCISMALSLNRIAFGAHFLSDVLLSSLIILAILLTAKVALKGRIGAIIDRTVAGEERAG